MCVFLHVLEASGWNGSKNRLTARPPSSKFLVRSLQNSHFFLTSPLRMQKKCFLEDETGDRFTFGGFLGDSNGTKGEDHLLIERVTFPSIRLSICWSIGNYDRQTDHLSNQGGKLRFHSPMNIQMTDRLPYKNLLIIFCYQLLVTSKRTTFEK